MIVLREIINYDLRFKVFISLYIYTNYCWFYNQVFYYLGELNDSLSYALGAGPLFDVSEDSDYVHTLLGKNYLLIFPFEIV